ncbi:MAG: DUF3820 family protein [Verrucomicrobiota bacterium]
MKNSSDQTPDFSDQQVWVDALTTWTMPFGRFHGKLIIDLPLDYLLWFKQKGFPEGKLGYLMKAVCDAKGECGESVFDPLRSTPRLEGDPGPKKREWKFHSPDSLW